MIYHLLIITITTLKLKWIIYIIIILFVFFVNYRPSVYIMHNHNTFLTDGYAQNFQANINSPLSSALD